MNNIYKPQYNLFVIPLEDFKIDLKNWFKFKKKIDIDFVFSFEYPERGFSKMGDLYFEINEDNMLSVELEKIEKLYNYSDGMMGGYIFKAILKDFFNVSYIHYDFDVNKEEIHIRTKIID